VVVGAMLGLVVGVAHLVVITNRHQQSRRPGPRQDQP
jgi:hypothetical protein